MKQSLFPLLLYKSLSKRRARSAVTLAALLLGACLVGALLSVSMDIGRKAGTQLQAYGANLLLLPRGGALAAQGDSGSYLAETELNTLESHQGAGSLYFAPYLYGIVEASGQKIVLGGTRLQVASPLASWWKVEGTWPDPAEPGTALAGVAAARALGISPGDTISVRYGTSTLPLRISGILETGGSEDSQLLTHLPAVQKLLGKEGAVGLVQVRAQAGTALEPLARQLEEQVSSSEARIVGQVAHAEEQVLGKVQLLMALVAALVLLASSLSVSSTLATAVLERTREIGLMKALGASDGSIAALLLAEVLVLGLLGGLMGYGLGLGLAQVIGYSVFDSAISPQPEALALTLSLALAVALTCCVIPLRRALAVEPAIILKGE
ncbi:MAG TPA: FtsX-like permease family protein [Dehalococcoidia bacterium]|nr:FtsX-like permease family protein [Dehalococcoidia bacterium]